MTPDSSLYARVQRRLPELVDDLRSDPGLRAAAEVAEGTLRALLGGLREARDPTVSELAELRAAGVRRAEERVPLGVVVAACHAGAHLGWRALVDDAGPEDGPALVAAAEHLLRYLGVVTAAIADAYLEEQQAIQGEERDARRSLASALLSGDAVERPAARLGVRVASAYVALALHLGGDADPSVAVRHQLRRVQERLDAFAGEPVLGLLDPAGATVLLPTVPDDVSELLERLPTLVADIRSVTGTDVTAGAAGCIGLEGVARAGRQAGDVLGIARRLGRPPGVYLLGDVLLEYQLTRDSDARPLLAGLLDPLAANADLLRTLEAYFSHDLDRRSTAGSLHVHPNTLDYRLRRIAALTGLDPARPTGQQLLAAALTARRLGDGADG